MNILRRRSVWTVIALLPIVTSGSGATAQAADCSEGSRLASRAYFQAGYPRLVFFRTLEQLAEQGVSPAVVDQRIQGHDLIVAKAFDEERVGLAEPALPFYRAVKTRHPEMLFLLHFDGHARDPRDRSIPFFTGYWLHRVGCRITSDLSPTGEIAEVTVEDPALFSMSVGVRGRLPDTMTICALNYDGTPNWLVTESVNLLAIDASARRLKIKRAILHTQPRGWRAGEAYIAPVAVHGHFAYAAGSTAEIINLWKYNFSVSGPKDAQGRRLPEVLAEDLVAKLKPGGPADLFDGVEFDVMPFRLRNSKFGDGGPRNSDYIARFGYAEEDVDTNGDGKRDSANPGGFDPYAAGVAQMLHRLRAGLGSDRLIMMDANRCAGRVLNGVETEGWPEYPDAELDEWSSGINDQFFWAAHGATPRVRYFQRYGPDQTRTPRSRLIMAAAQLLGTALVTVANPPPVEGETWGAFDELKMGVEHRLHWLGQPREAARRLALNGEDLFQGEGATMTRAFQARVSSVNGVAVFEPGGAPGLKLRARQAEQRYFRVKLDGLSLSDPNLVIAFKVKAEPMRGMPDEYARKITVRLVSHDGGVNIGTGQWAWADSEWFNPVFYFRGMKSEMVDVMIECDGPGPVYIQDMKAYAKADAMCREFDGGLVLANPGLAPYAFDLAALYPGEHFRRIRGSANQDPKINNGAPVGDSVTVAPNDGLFLVREP